MFSFLFAYRSSIFPFYLFHIFIFSFLLEFLIFSLIIMKQIKKWTLHVLRRRRPMRPNFSCVVRATARKLVPLPYYTVMCVYGIITNPSAFRVINHFYTILSDFYTVVRRTRKTFLKEVCCLKSIQWLLKLL